MGKDDEDSCTLVLFTTCEACLATVRNVCHCSWRSPYMRSTSNTFGFRTVSLSLPKRFISTDLSPNDIQMKWNGSGFRPLLCTYRLNWARRTSWGWWDEWDDTALQTQDSKLKPWRSEAGHATYRSRRSPTILSFTSGWGRNISFSPPRPGNEQPNSSVKGSGANHYPRAPAQQIVLKHWKELKVSLLPNNEQTCKQSLIHNWKS